VNEEMVRIWKEPAVAQFKVDGPSFFVPLNVFVMYIIIKDV
jgi:hypothetical protein